MRLRRGIHLTINGIAAGLRNTELTYGGQEEHWTAQARIRARGGPCRFFFFPFITSYPHRYHPLRSIPSTNSIPLNTLPAYIHPFSYISYLLIHS